MEATRPISLDRPWLERVWFERGKRSKTVWQLALILAVVPSAGGADAVAFGPEGAVLDGCTFDGIPLHGTVGPSGQFWLTRDAAEWQAFGMRADMEAPFRLADDGGEATLTCPTHESTLAWNRTTFGEIVYQEPGPRVHKAGQSDLPMHNFTAEESWLFVWPNGRAVWESILSETETRLALHMYDLRSEWLVDALTSTNATQKAALVDHAIGLTAVEAGNRQWALATLASNGFEVVEPGNRYRYHHLKVLVADDWVIIQSENGSPTGMPASGDGNRGWGGAFRSKAMADWFWDWMQEDREAWDVTPWQGNAVAPAHPLPDGNANAPAPLHIGRPIQVRPLVSPDHTLGSIWDEVAASERIWTEQLQIGDWESNRQGWSQPDRFAQILAERDARVHVSPYTDHAGTVMPGLHNKAILMDDAVWFGSMNGNHASRADNREVSVWLDDPEAVAYFEAAFERPVPLPMLFVGAVLVAFIRRF